MLYASRADTVAAKCAPRTRSSLNAGGVVTQGARHCGRHVTSTRTGISFLTGTAKSDGGSILKSDRVAGMVPDIRIWFPCVASCNNTCLYWTVWPANWISRSTWTVADADAVSGNRV